MGTEKRERQKANRQQRLMDEAKAERSGKIRRNVIRWSLAAVLAIGAVVVIAWIGGAFSGDDEVTESTLAPLVTTPIDTADTTESTVTTPAVTAPPSGTTPADDSTGKPSVSLPETPVTELVVTDLEEGEGDPAEAGDLVEVEYVGVRSVNGEEFDSNFGAGAPFALTLGAGEVIDGWDEGLVGVKVGGVRQIDIPAELAYADQARGIIQPGDDLSFVVEVVAITPGDE